MKTTNGDLIKLALEGKFDIIIHGCNCFCKMGAGIAKAIKTEFPEAFQSDYKTKKGDRSKLGDFTSATVHRNGYIFIVINAYTQYDYRGSGVKVDYDAVRNVFRRLKSEFSGKRFSFPLIGSGLAGGDWSIISNIISEEMQGENITLIRFNK